MGYRDGGFVFEAPPDSAIPERVIRDGEAKAEQLVFSRALEPYLLPWIPGSWQPYLDIIPEGSLKKALEELQVAVDVYDGDFVTVAGIYAGRSKTKAFVGDVAASQGLMSCWRRMGRGVNRLALALTVTSEHHDIVFGDQDGIIGVDDLSKVNSQEFPIHWCEYLPNIDRTQDYTVRYDNFSVLALAGAVRPVLHENGLKHVWERYVSSVR